jgi:uncharacterized protein DUF1552
MSLPVFSRRRALQALAAIPATLPLARKLWATDVAPAPKRLILLMQNNGTQQANFWPDANLSSRILDSLFTDPKTGQPNGLKAKTNVVKGVYVPYDRNGTNGNEHDMGFARMFSGEKLVSVAGQPWGGGASVDQILAQEWGVDSLTLAVLASRVEPYPKPGFDHRRSFSYLGPATLKYPRQDPLEVYGDLFPGSGGPGGPTPSARLKLRQSVLDATAGNLSEISMRLGPGERAKVDYHLTAIRNVENALAGGIAKACAGQPSAPTDYLKLDPNAEISVDTYIPQMVGSMIELAAASLVCGLKSIVTLQLGFCGGKWSFDWKGIGMDLHTLAHLDTSDAGSTPENTERLVLANQYYASCVAKLAALLDAVPEGDGTVLDNTTLVWANEQGRGDHNQANVPIVLIGKAGGALPRGGRLIDAGPQVFNRLGCTILNLMGKPAAGFGDIPDCGVFEGL